MGGRALRSVKLSLMQATVLVALGASPLMSPNGIMNHIFVSFIYIFAYDLILMPLIQILNNIPQGKLYNLYIHM
jgi:ABC-type phosphate transport system permease subunit